MPIRIVDSTEPLSASALSGAECILVESDASRLLTQELIRYCRREVTGRSFLIAGHRGSGKTTMVSAAYLQVLRESLRRTVPLRPLLVQLHGPNLFPNPMRAPQEEAASNERSTSTTRGNDQKKKERRGAADGDTEGGGAGRSGENEGDSDRDIKNEKKPAPKEKSETEIALEQITLALHRAVAREFANAFRSAIGRRIGSLAIAAGRFGGMRRQAAREAFELAASFEKELYESPGDARLRDYWARARALGRGVLGYGGDATSRSEEAGSRELVALASVCDAYRRLSGTFEYEEQLKNEAKREIEATLSSDSLGRALTPAIVSVLAGGLAGAGLFAATGSGTGATIGGLLSALGSASVFKVSSKRSRSDSATREYRFIFDLSAATLDRVLPILIERLLDAGLAPIFVVDELDKVDDLSRRILGMVHHLKKLVAENAFFCFLTDRTYFEKVALRSSSTAYPVEYTYYSHLLFTSFAPQDFRRYLIGEKGSPTVAESKGILRVEPNAPGATTTASAPVSPLVAQTPAKTAQASPEQAAQPSPSAPSSAPAPPPAATAPTPQQIAADDEVDAKILAYVLLHRSQLHPLDLKRLVAGLRGEGGNVALRPGQIRGPQFSRDVQIQLAIELVLEQRDLDSWISRSPERRRLAYDALYYISREWPKQKELILFDQFRTQFDTYLSDRIGTEGSRPEDLQRERRAKRGSEQSADELVRVDAPTRDFLYRWVQYLATLLSDHGAYARLVTDTNEQPQRRGAPPIPGEVVEAAALEADQMLLHIQEPNRYSWRFDPAGLNPNSRPGGPLALEGYDWTGDLKFIGDVVAALREVAA
jgi:hypothetical protein